MAVKALVYPLLTGHVGRHGNPRKTLRWLAFFGLVVFAAIAVSEGFWALLALSLVAVLAPSGIAPLAEVAALPKTVRWRLDYGRVRVWGSLAFIAAALGAGALLDVLPTAALIWVILAALGLLAVATWTLPRTRHRADPGLRSTPRALGPEFWLMIAGAMLIQTSHAFYYALGSLHWQSLGFDGIEIGSLWAWGVIAEVLLFAVGAPLFRRAGPAGLLAIGAVGGMVRWSVLATDPGFAVAFAFQTLHAATFAATHMAGIVYIRDRVPAARQALAQGYYAALSMGPLMGLVTIGVGPAYEAVAGTVYLAMAALCAAGLAAAWALAHRMRAAG